MRRLGDSTLLLVLLVVEIAVFSLIAERFFTVGNLFEVLRFSVELGLLAVALTPILITGGIDLSVGSMMGLSAVVFGAAARDWGLPLPVAALLADGTGLAGGALNATADHAPAAAAAHRHAGLVLALSRDRRSHDAAAR